jgi:MraZ protein
MAVFKGECIYSLDEKGRIKLPPAFRQGLLSPESGNRVYLLRDVEPCLGIYSVEQYALLEAKVADLDLGILANRRLMRRFVSSATECTVDGQGRIMLPAHFMEYAQLSRSGPALFAGFRNYVQLWNKDLYEKEFDDPLDMHSDVKHQLELR